MLEAIKKHLYSFMNNIAIFYYSLQRKNSVLALQNITDGPYNAVLQTKHDISKAVNKVKKLKLRPNRDTQKNWDLFITFSFIFKTTNLGARILDMGSGMNSKILEWLNHYGYNQLIGMDLCIPNNHSKFNINYLHGDIQNTELPSNAFDIITCLSVIEHGVSFAKYCKEVSRLLKVGGHVITSTDYWETPINIGGGLYPYGKSFGKMKIYTKGELNTFIKIAKKYSLELISPINLNCNQKAVHWLRVNKRFTYAIFTMKKVR